MTTRRQATTQRERTRPGTKTYRDFTGSAAQAYQRFFVPAIATPVSTQLVNAAALRTGEAVLDVACGTGLIARRAAAAVGVTGTVTGVDLAPDMIDVAAATDQPQGADIEWQVTDAVSIPQPDRSYDVALCQMGLMFIENKAAALAEMHRILKFGGRIVINVPGLIQPPFEGMASAIAEHINPELAGFVRAVFSMHDPEPLGDLLAQVGFGEVATTEYVAEFDLPGPAEFLWQYINLTPMAPRIAEASEETQAEMEAQVVNSWAGWVVDGRVPLAQPMVLATARR